MEGEEEGGGTEGRREGWRERRKGEKELGEKELRKRGVGGQMGGWEGGRDQTYMYQNFFSRYPNAQLSSPFPPPGAVSMMMLS